MIYDNINSIVNEYALMAIHEEEELPKGTYRLIPMSDVPKDFKSSVLDMLDAIEDIVDDKVGLGVRDAMLGRLKYRHFNTTRKRIDKRFETNKGYASFALIVPTELVKKFNPGFNNAEAHLKMFGDIAKKAGFKAGAWDHNFANMRYYYKYSKDKKFIFSSYIFSTDAAFGGSKGFQMHIGCTENCEESKKVIVESAQNGFSVFDNLELI